MPDEEHLLVWNILNIIILSKYFYSLYLFFQKTKFIYVHLYYFIIAYIILKMPL